MSSSEIIEVLKRCELFSMVSEEDIALIATLCEIEHYDTGDTVFAQGEFGRKMYLVAEGQIALLRSLNLGERRGTTTIDLLGRGRGMGWSSLMCEPCNVSASAVCQKPTSLVALEGAALRAMLESKPALGFIVMDRLVHVLGHRLRAAYGIMDTFR